MELKSVENHALLYQNEDMDFFLEDKEMAVNQVIYDRIIQKMSPKRSLPLYVYFRYAYAVCAKLNCDKYPEAHFRDEYWESIDVEDEHRLMIFAIAYILIAFQDYPRMQYSKMMQAIFLWELEGEHAKYSHTLLKFFLPVIKQCLEEGKKCPFRLIPGEPKLYEEDEEIIKRLIKSPEIDLTVGRPQTDKEAERFITEKRDCLKKHIAQLEEEIAEDKQKTAKPKNTTAADAQPAPAAPEAKTEQKDIQQQQGEEAVKAGVDESIILVSTLLNLSLNPRFTHISALADFVSSLTGDKPSGIQSRASKIWKMKESGEYTNEVKDALANVQRLLLKIKKKNGNDISPETTQKINAMLEAIKLEFPTDE